MIGSSGRGSSTASPTACWRSSTSTRARSSRGRRHARRLLRASALLAFAILPGCAYLNTFYNAERAFDEGVRLSRAAGGDSLAADARAAFQRAAEKSAIVLARYGDSDYADDALLLLARSLDRLGSHADAAQTFRRYLERFPDTDEAARARLALVRCERMAGDLEAAAAALTPLVDGEAAGVEAAEILHEKARIEQGSGDHDAAAASFRELFERYPEYAGDRQVALGFADAELAAGRYDAAIEAYAALVAASGDPVLRRGSELKIARAHALAGRRDEALEAYDGVLATKLPDSLAAEIHAERGDLLAADGAWDEAASAYARVAQLAPGSEAASRATLRRARILWRADDDRERALDLLLDAFLHEPTSAWGDSARAEARALARVLHYEDLAAGSGPLPGIEDPALARSTALFRLGEEVLDAESDPAAAAEIFARFVDRYPDSPWRPRALLAAGLLQLRAGERSRAESILDALLADHPETGEADSARRALGLPVPDRPVGFYSPAPQLVTLAAALPRVEDPMLRIVDQLDRYADRPVRGEERIGRPGARASPGTPAPGRPGAQEEPELDPPGPEVPEPEGQGPRNPIPEGRDVPEGVQP